MGRSWRGTLVSSVWLWSPWLGWSWLAEGAAVQVVPGTAGARWLYCRSSLAPWLGGAWVRVGVLRGVSV